MQPFFENKAEEEGPELEADFDHLFGIKIQGPGKKEVKFSTQQGSIMVLTWTGFWLVYCMMFVTSTVSDYFVIFTYYILNLYAYFY